MSDANILVSLEEGVATLTFNRPKALNALNAATLRELSPFWRGTRTVNDYTEAVALAVNAILNGEA